MTQTAPAEGEGLSKLEKARRERNKSITGALNTATKVGDSLVKHIDRNLPKDQFAESKTLTETIKKPDIKVAAVKEKEAETDKKASVQAVKQIKQTKKGQPTNLAPVIKTFKENYSEQFKKDPQLGNSFKMLAGYKDRIKALQTEKRDEVAKSEWMQVAEMMGHALTQLGAGAYGLKHGVDMGGLKFDKMNWGKRLDTRLNLIDGEIGQLERATGKEEGKVALTEQRATEEKRFRQQMKQQLDIAKAKSAGKVPSKSKTQEIIDKEFGKNYAKSLTSGGLSDSKKQITELGRVITKLGTTDTATGPGVGLLPKIVRDVLLPEGAGLQDNVEEIIQRNLRTILGAQFTEKEGVRLISRAYNPRLDEKENIRRLNTLLVQMKEGHALQQQATEYFLANDTLAGFKGKDKLYTSVYDFDVMEGQLKAGTVEDGHKFTGGDPADRKNWEKVK